MMKLNTPIDIQAPLHPIALGSRVVLLGSCFAQNIGTRMRQSGFPALVNPFGVLYNPLSILQALAQTPTFDKLYFEDSDHRWHCWLTDSSMNASSLEACKAAVLSARGRVFVQRTDTLILTLGTSRYYEHNGFCVGNCHKVPQSEFCERELSVEQIVQTLESICQLFEHTQIVFTVSPYRYAKYGFHESRLSKAKLLLAVDEMCQRRPHQVAYFPAYEIQLDELRDYRFYDADMLHPSPQAIDYIWERFVATWFDVKAQNFFVDYEPIRKALAHRPSDPDSPAAIRFHEQTQERLKALITKYQVEL